MTTHNETPILVLSFEPIVGSSISDTFVYYYNGIKRDGTLIDAQFILEDSLRRLKDDLTHIRDKSNLYHKTNERGQDLIFHRDEPILIMGSDTSILIQQED